jgi:hypothetical protein
MAVKKDIAIATDTVTEAIIDMVTEGSTGLEIETETASEAGTVTKCIIDHGVLPREIHAIQNRTFPHLPLADIKEDNKPDKREKGNNPKQTEE